MNLRFLSPYSCGLVQLLSLGNDVDSYPMAVDIAGAHVPTGLILCSTTISRLDPRRAGRLHRSEKACHADWKVRSGR